MAIRSMCSLSHPAGRCVRASAVPPMNWIWSPRHGPRKLIAGTTERPHTAHDVAARATTNALPTDVQHVMQRRRTAVLGRNAEHLAWRHTVRIAAAERATDRARDANRSRSIDEGLEV
jgi:hypothetical protein